MSKLSKSSMGEFMGQEFGEKLCNTKIVLGQFRNKKEYEEFVSESLKNIELKKKMQKELES